MGAQRREKGVSETRHLGATLIGLRLKLSLFLFSCVCFVSSSTLPNVGETPKTADLSLLVNETVSINKRLQHPTASGANSKGATIANGQAQFRDDWTFDRVEYDLIEFLQELNARYQQRGSVKNNETEIQETTRPNGSGDELLQGKSDQTSQLGVGELQQVCKEVDKPPGQKVVEEQPKQQQGKMGQTVQPDLMGVSLASEDQDISESNWQYGIFDRFTRARSSQQPHHEKGTTPDPSLSVASLQLDVRVFNSDECGLRSYLPDEPPNQTANMFPPSDLLALSEYDSKPSGGEASKELNQRRQRPPQVLGSASKHRNTPTNLHEQVSATSDSGEKSGEKGPADFESTLMGDSERPDQLPSASNIDSEPTADNESFNLNSRRQWLQQQLGTTLQLLGFNTTNQSPSEFLNQTSGLSLNRRENAASKAGPLAKASRLFVGDKREQTQVAAEEAASISKRENAMLIKQLDLLRARQDELKLEARVIGGTDARLGDSPWSVSLQALVSRPGTGGLEYRHYCGGTIISDHYILTAAHCLDFMVGRESRLFVAVGDLNWRMSANSVYGKRYGIDKLVIHSGYKSTAFGHDIGLIKTKEPIKPIRVSGRYIVNSVCLPERNVEHSGEAELVGWGLFSNRNEMADSLQIADVPILPRPLCVDLYRRRTGLIQWLIGIELITDKQICAGTFGRGICQGDSGSALVYNEKVSRVIGPDGRASTSRLLSNSVRDQQSKATIIGIVAFGGIRRCSYQSLPGVYMQTSKYLDWILPRISS